MNDWKDALAALQDSLPEETGGIGEPKLTEVPASTSRNVADSSSAGHPVLTLFYEKKGRAGKPATIITGFDPDDSGALEEAEMLARTLKQRLGCGGSSRGGEILLQGDRRDQLRRLLPSLGFKCKN